MGKLLNPQERLNQVNFDQSYHLMSSNMSPNSPLDLSMKNRDNRFFSAQTSPLDLSTKPLEVNHKQVPIYDLWSPPEILIEPKREWHYRSQKDLANNHLPCLAGNGPQRTPIRVRVPPISNSTIYLCIAVVTCEDEPHPSKVIVPAKTKMNTNHFSHDNSLDYLQFDECSSTEHFDPATRFIYSQISSTEHNVQYKDVRIRMFNLYQNQLITKEMITTKQLNRCKLRFHLCIHENGKFIPISYPSFSVVIEEQKMTARSRQTEPINKSTTLSDPYDQFRIDYGDQENIADDNSY